MEGSAEHVPDLATASDLRRIIAQLDSELACGLTRVYGRGAEEMLHV